MKVLKFGGTSVGSVAALQKVEQIVRQAQTEGPIVVVVSAFSKITNLLVSAGKMAATANEGWKDLFAQIETRHIETIGSLLKAQNQGKIFAATKVMLNELEDILHGVYLVREQTDRTADMILSFGERLAAPIIAAWFQQEGLQSQAADARQFIRTFPPFGKARVDFETTEKLCKQFFTDNPGLHIVTGFIGSTEKNETTTLGRGGSDYTAAILGSALNATLIEIWTDVDGMLTADPNLVKKAFTLPEVSYQEAMELSHFGAKVIYPPTLQPAFSRNIPIRICNTFRPEVLGTIISAVSGNWEYQIKGISSISDVALVNLTGSGIVGVAGVAATLFTEMARLGINIILISQASSEHSICLAVAPEDAERAQLGIEKVFAPEIESGKMEVSVTTQLSTVAIIGENMRHSPGIAGRIFTALGRNGVNIVAAAQGSSELNISIVIDRPNLNKALNALHETFFQLEVKTINLFLIGPGLIGGTLLKQIAQQTQYLAEDLNVKIPLIGLANSRLMLVNENGINADNWQTELAGGETANVQSFVEKAIALNLPNSVFADCTANNTLIPYYKQILQASIAIVTPNKIANSASYADYMALKLTAQKYNTRFLYETNVGAGLPIINTLQGLINSGDRILKIEAVLSGTLSYIFNNFKPGKPFASIVREAQNLGYTEPDPRDDLNGKDMGRKMLILAREMGLKTEPEDIKIENLLPESSIAATTVSDFYKSLEKENDFFAAKLNAAEAAGGCLRFIGTIEKGKVSIALQIVDFYSPFYGLNGADNMIVFTTDRYRERQLVVKGPGAGAEVTSAGVFSDIISLRH